MRLRRIPGTKEALTGYPDLVIMEPSIYHGCWSKYFGNENSIHLELGMGKGKFLNTLAGQNPQTNFLGVEFREEMVHRAVAKVGVYPNNIGFIWGNVEQMEEFFAPSEISRIYLNFSDPWPKNRHEKRRLTHRNFLHLYQRILSPGGEIHFKTDNKDLFEFSLNEFAYCGFFLKNITLDLHKSQFAGNIMTEYEERYGPCTPIYRCEAYMLTKFK